ncbi:RlpA-like double-psi beta-barrel domain [Phaffia rhodozyma]|uniref:RlpA-like double-psi beta-barrel domain n=1 Tax=Phaffia rhodozyma TaxID=264483 RepID=A0A0F7SQJ0_PHARH|nr:RlpA-like double-psi beta-barrel domain [Phaffia rhodozyma]
MFATIAALSLPLLALAAPVDVEKRGGSRFTYYDTSVGLGACGNWNANSAYTVALNSADYAAWGGGYPSAACGQQIWVSYGGNTVSATIQDECPTCSSGELDLSEGLFGALASMDLGVIYGSWGYSSSGAAAATTTKAAEPTTTWTPEPTTTWTPEPTTTWTPEPTTTSTSSAAAEPTTWAAEAIVSTTESAAAAAATSAYGQQKIVRPWTGVNASATCPDARLVLWNVTDVTYNSTWHTVNSSLLDSVLSSNETKRFCLNSAISKYTGAANLTALVDEFKVVV